MDEVFGRIYGEGEFGEAADNTCGPNSFVALNTLIMVNMKHENGLFLRACDHGVLNNACNIKIGESYGYHTILPCCSAPPDVTLCVRIHCSDIACRTCSWAVKMESTVGHLLEGVENLNLTSKVMDVAPVVNAMHARGHAWYCQIL